MHTNHTALCMGLFGLLSIVVIAHADEMVGTDNGQQVFVHPADGQLMLADAGRRTDYLMSIRLSQADNVPPTTHARPLPVVGQPGRRMDDHSLVASRQLERADIAAFEEISGSVQRPDRSTFAYSGRRTDRLIQLR